MQQLVLNIKELPYGIEEELKSLRTNILLCGDDKRIIIITSCFASEGKSTVTRELARTFVEMGKNVLLVDTDIRKSVVKDLVVKGNIKYGLVHYLAGLCHLDETIYETQLKGLNLIPAGAFPPNPAEILAFRHLREVLFDKLKDQYDYIFVDAAPLGLVTDAAIVAQECDGSILLIESGSVPRRMAQDVMIKLKNTKCPVLGVVLNKVDYHRNKYYGYGRYYGKRYENYYK